MIDIVRFDSPHFLWLLMLIAPMVAYYIYKLKDGKATIQLSSIGGLLKGHKTVKYYLRHLPFVIRIAAFSLFVTALARPQSTSGSDSITTEGIDIVLSLDISGSMLARDFSPDRITAAKDVATNFILDRKNDRIGLVVFAGESFTQSPLTTDHATLINLLNNINSGAINDGTAIGNGLATAVARLKESDAKSKVVILLTDGVNNSGQVAPQTAAELAKTLGIKVYTIGVGTEGTAPYPVRDPWGNIAYQQAKVEIDEEVLKQIAQQTDGKYFRATSNDKLKSIYDEINALEKTKIDIQNYVSYQEQYMLILLMAIALVICEVIIKHLYLKQIP